MTDIDKDYIVCKWFAWRPVCVGVQDNEKIVWLKYVARWWHPSIGFFGCWIYADWEKWKWLENRKVGGI